jgi:hypothetical protein
MRPAQAQKASRTWLTRPTGNDASAPTPSHIGRYTPRTAGACGPACSDTENIEAMQISTPRVIALTKKDTNLEPIKPRVLEERKSHPWPQQ